MTLPPPYPSPYAPAPPPAGRPVSELDGPMPTVPCDYPQLLRGPRFRWWRPLLSLLLVVAFAGVAWSALFILFDLVGGGGGARPLIPALGDVDDDLSPAGSLSADLLLAVFIPVVGLATWVAHRIRPRFVSSVAGRLRWGWLLRCLLVAVPVWVVYLGVGFLVEPPESGRPDKWVILLVMAIVITPFQAAGEEYLFRGWLTQNVGAYFDRPVVGVVVSTTCSAALFSLAHGSFDPWVLGNIATLAVAACYANWRTGGLEAGIALHLVNNVLLGIATTTIGGYADSFVSETTTGTPLDAVFGVLVNGVAVVLILWQARRRGVQRRYSPADPAPVAPPTSGPGPVRPATWYVPLGRPPVA